jgi:hypothetical protein
VNVANAYHPWVAAYYAAPSRVLTMAVNSGKMVAVDRYAGLLELEFKPDSVPLP